MLVSEIMNTNVVSVLPDESAKLASTLLYRYNIGALPVCGSDGKIRGMVTDRDIVLRCVAADNDPAETAVSEIMSRSIITVAPEDDIAKATRLMSSGQVRRLPVVKDGKLVGIITLGDMANTRRLSMEASKALSEISSNVRNK